MYRSLCISLGRRPCPRAPIPAAAAAAAGLLPPRTAGLPRFLSCEPQIKITAWLAERAFLRQGLCRRVLPRCKQVQGRAGGARRLGACARPLARRLQGGQLPASRQGPLAFQSRVRGLGPHERRPRRGCRPREERRGLQRSHPTNFVIRQVAAPRQFRASPWAGSRPQDDHLSPSSAPPETPARSGPFLRHHRARRSRGAPRST